MKDPELREMVAGPVGGIETRLQLPDTAGRCDWVAVIAHPHPLYGGTMDNKVVTTLARMYNRLGVAAVRFNFRGVGSSAGEHDEGRGEVADMLAVAAWARQQCPGAELLLAGYSFGSAVAAGASEVLPARHLALVAPPVDRYLYAPQGDFGCPTAIVAGGADELVDADGVSAWATERPAVGDLIILPEATHFFHGQLVALEHELAPAVLRALR